MAAVAAANESELQAAAALQPPLTTAAAAAAADARPLVATTLDPRLLMAARRGDREALKDLLQLNDDDDQQGQDTRPDDEGSGTQQSTTAAAAAASTITSVAAAPPISHPHFIVQVDPRRHEAVAAPLPPPPVPVVDEDGVTTRTEGGSLLIHSEIVEPVVEPPAPPHDAALPARQPPAAGVPALDEDLTTMEGDSLLHVVAACGDDDKYLSCSKIIVRNKKKKGGDAAKRLALEARNRKGDTPLHCAAAAGNAHMISCLIGLIANDTTDNEAAAAAAALKKAFLRTPNLCGETALHQAVRAAKNNEACIDQLMDVDSDLACIPSDEDGGGGSPLYLAISLGEVEIARHLLYNSKISKGGKLSYSGPGGRNVLHAAVSSGQGEAALRLVLEWFLKGPKGMAVDDMVMRLQQARARGDDLHRLLSQLASQRDKENGSTPLHLVASLAGLPSPCMYYKTHPHFWRLTVSPARLLLEANESMAYQPDKRGLYPIHVAGGAGSLGVVRALLWKCPDCATLQDSKGRTFLHIAVEEGRYDVVRYVCDQSQKKQKQNPAAGLLSSILNMQDIQGNTPLHRAVHAGNLPIFYRLVRNRRVRLDLPNKEGMRPIDVSWSKMPLKCYYAWDPRLRIRNYLVRVGAPYGETRGDCFDQKHILPKQDEEKMSANLTSAAQVLCIFSVLITTVTFASAFTLPGGYRSAGDGGGVAGTPVLAGRSYAFDAFVLADTLAFIFSLYATSLLLYVGVAYGTLPNRFNLINLAYTMMWHSARSLVAAFGLGLYVVLLPVAPTIAIAAVAVLMVIIPIGFLKESEGIPSIFVIGRIPIRAPWNYVLRYIVLCLDRFWSYIIIFGLPAIRKWASLP